jgi:hypothetical protein
MNRDLSNEEQLTADLVSPANLIRSLRCWADFDL